MGRAMARIKALKVGDVYIVAYRRRGIYADERHYAVVARTTAAYTTYNCVEAVNILVELLKSGAAAEVVELEVEVEENDLYKEYRWKDGVVMLEPDEELVEP